MNFLPFQFNIARRGVVLEDGSLLSVLPSAEFEDGALVQIGFRPEQSQLVGAGQGLFDCSKTSLFPLLQRSAPTSPPARHLHFFDVARGRRIAPRSVPEQIEETSLSI